MHRSRSDSLWAFSEEPWKASKVLPRQLVEYSNHPAARRSYRIGPVAWTRAIRVGVNHHPSSLCNFCHPRLDCPEILRVRWFRYVSRNTVRLIANHSGLTLMIVVSSQLRFQTDENCDRDVFSTSAITFFSIGARIVDYATNVILCIAQFSFPCLASRKRRVTRRASARCSSQGIGRVHCHFSDHCDTHHFGKIHHRGMGWSQIYSAELPRAVGLGNPVHIYARPGSSGRC